MDIVINITNVNGTVIRIPYAALEPTNQGGTDDSKDAYDQQGAMQFIVATVLVYSILGVFCTLMNRIRRLRGKSHENYVQDESISKYLKKEKLLKMDGRKMKLLYECNLIEDKINQFEEKQKLLNLEKEMTSDFTKESNPGERKKRYRKRKHDIRNTIGKMGASLFFIGSQHSLNTNNNLHDDVSYDDDMTSQDVHAHLPKGESTTVDIEIHRKNNHLTVPFLTLTGCDDTEIHTVQSTPHLPYHCSDV